MALTLGEVGQAVPELCAAPIFLFSHRPCQAQPELLGITLDCRHEVALKCPGGTKAISLGFQPVSTRGFRGPATRWRPGRDTSDASARGWVCA